MSLGSKLFTFISFSLYYLKLIKKNIYDGIYVNTEQIQEIKLCINESLNQAEKVWGEVGEYIIEKTYSINAMDSQTPIPGYPFLKDGKPKKDQFIAMVLDIRESSTHLIQNISSKTSEVSDIQRVYYETSALLPAMAKTIGFFKGNVTEYLGDGLLALFLKESDKALYSAKSAAEACINETLKLVNDELKLRYKLPELKIGIGMGLSKAIITLVGDSTYKQPKVIGKCVYYASKLSNGTNEYIIDEAMRLAWPKTKNGILSFTQKNMKGISGFTISKKAK